MHGVRNVWRAVATLAGVAACVAAGGDARAESSPAPDPGALRERARLVFATLPAEAESESNPITAEKVKLGRMLYYDERFSASGTISCNSCHDLAAFGVDHEPTSPGHEGERGDRNSPSVYNAAFHIAQFWDGRAADVEEQAKGPVLNPVEMGMPDEATVEKKLASVPDYGPLFARAFPDDADPVSFENMAFAIAAFERRLVTPSRFDAFLEGDTDALTEEELVGLDTFMKTGCTTCHTGALVGGDRYMKMGMVNALETRDPGRYAVTKDEADRYFFKVPSLRNVAETHPYFHDGSVGDLEAAIRLMGWHQLGKELGTMEVVRIATFLRALTGDIDESYIAPPELPESAASAAAGR